MRSRRLKSNCATSTRRFTRSAARTTSMLTKKRLKNSGLLRTGYDNCFNDMVTFLMKRKFKEGTECLTSMVKGGNISDFLKPMLYTYRAYGYFCLGKYQKALNDFNYIGSFSKLDKACSYNKYLCEGIISALNN